MAPRKPKLPVLESVAHNVTYNDGFFYLFVEGAILTSPNKDAFNKVLARMGYKAVRLTRNILNPNSHDLVIDEDTPLCCDPGSETYHSM